MGVGGMIAAPPLPFFMERAICRPPVLIPRASSVPPLGPFLLIANGIRTATFRADFPKL